VIEKGEHLAKIPPFAYYFDSGDTPSVREMGLFYAEIPRKA
jgi:hypothetical protein